MLAPFIVPVSRSGGDPPRDGRDRPLTIAGISVTTSIGPVTHRAADPLLGVQTTAVSGRARGDALPFERGLEWIPAGKPIARQLRLAIKSYSDRAQRFELKVSCACGSARIRAAVVRDAWSRTAARALSPLCAARCRPDGTSSVSSADRLAARSFSRDSKHCGTRTFPPVNFTAARRSICSRSRSTPRAGLVVAYVPGVRDDVDAMLRQLGVASIAVNAEDLLSVDLSKFSTLVIGPRACEVHPEIAAQNARLLDFVRNGGTMCGPERPVSHERIRSPAVSRRALSSGTGARHDGRRARQVLGADGRGCSTGRSVIGPN